MFFNAGTELFETAVSKCVDTSGVSSVAGLWDSRVVYRYEGRDDFGQ